MSKWSKDELEDMLFAVVDELNLSEKMIDKHGPLGTKVHELVREVIEQKDREIELLKKLLANATHYRKSDG